MDCKKRMVKIEMLFKIIEFLYNHKLFSIHKKCWAMLVSNYFYRPYINKMRDIPECNLCASEMYTYCGKECGCTEELCCNLHKEANEKFGAWHRYNDEHEEKLNYQDFEKLWEELK